MNQVMAYELLYLQTEHSNLGSVDRKDLENEFGFTLARETTLENIIED